jgi:hypothetical protein
LRERLGQLLLPRKDMAPGDAVRCSASSAPAMIDPPDVPETVNFADKLPIPWLRTPLVE